ncbi:hypothetical protein RCL1_003950 [Eukaryota sp. TZLM3-RCL]
MSKIVEAAQLDPAGNYSYELLESIKQTISRRWAGDYCNAHNVKHYGKKGELIERVLLHAAGKPVPSSRHYGKRGEKQPGESRPRAHHVYSQDSHDATSGIALQQGPRSVETVVAPAILPIEVPENILTKVDLVSVSAPFPAPSGSGYLPRGVNSDPFISHLFPGLLDSNSRRFVFPSSSLFLRIEKIKTKTFRILKWPDLDDQSNPSKQFLIQDVSKASICQTTIGSLYSCDCNSCDSPCNHIIFLLTKVLFSNNFKSTDLLLVNGLLSHELSVLFSESNNLLKNETSKCRVCCDFLQESQDLIACRFCLKSFHRICADTWREVSLRMGSNSKCPNCGNEFRS